MRFPDFLAFPGWATQNRSPALKITERQATTIHRERETGAAGKERALPRRRRTASKGLTAAKRCDIF
jgi:hypothetical protein